MEIILKSQDIKVTVNLTELLHEYVIGKDESVQSAIARLRTKKNYKELYILYIYIFDRAKDRHHHAKLISDGIRAVPADSRCASIESLENGSRTNDVRHMGIKRRGIRTSRTETERERERQCYV